MKDLTREDLIKLCELSVVHYSKWRNRDSYSAQKGIQDLYYGLTAGLDFRVVNKEDDPDYHSNENTLIIEFTQPIDREKLKNDGKWLEISELEEYFEDYGRESEMFDSPGIDWYDTWVSKYMPTLKRLEERGIGNDWY